jgi:hypothetical protein
MSALTESRIRRCFEFECEYCKDLSPSVASCSYPTRLIGQHGNSPRAVLSGKVCAYNLSYDFSKQHSPEFILSQPKYTPCPVAKIEEALFQARSCLIREIILEREKTGNQ